MFGIVGIIILSFIGITGSLGVSSIFALAR